MANLLKYSQHLLHSIDGTLTATLPWYIHKMDAANTAETSYYGRSPVVRITTNDSGDSSHQMQQAVGTHNGGVSVSVSVTCKYVDLPFIAIGFHDGSWKLQGFNLTTSAVGTSPANVSNAGVEALGGGIVRIYATYTMPATAALIVGFVLVNSLSPTTDVVSIASGSGVDMHGIQAEVGAVTDYEATTWGAATVITAFTAGATALWSATSTWQAGEAPLPGDTVSLNTASGNSSSVPIITVDVPEINCKTLAFSTTNGCRLAIANDCLITANTTLVGANGTYYAGYNWNGGNLTFDGNIDWSGPCVSSNSFNATGGIVNRNGSFASADLVFNGYLSHVAYGAYTATNTLAFNNTNAAATDTITFNGDVTRNVSSQSVYRGMAFYGAAATDITFNGTVSSSGTSTTGSGSGLISRVNGAGVLRVTFNGDVTSTGEGILCTEDSSVSSSPQNGIISEIVINGAFISNRNSSYGAAIRLYAARLTLGPDAVVRCVSGVVVSIQIYGTATMNASPTSVITTTNGVSRGTTPVVVLQNSQTHVLGVVDASNNNTAVASGVYGTIVRISPIILWSPILPAATCGLSIFRVVAGLSTGVYVGGTVDPLEIVVDEIVSIDPAIATGFLWCPGIFSENPYCRIRFKTMVSYQYGGWAVAGLVEPFDSSSQWIIYDRLGSQRVMGELDLGVIPSASDVRNGVLVGNSAGTLVVPQVSAVLDGTVFDNGAVGTLTVSATDYTARFDAIDAVASGVKAKTDQLTFSTGGVVADVEVSVGNVINYDERFDTLDTVTGEIKNKTDQLTFTASGVVADAGTTGGSAVDLSPVTSAISTVDGKVTLIKTKTDQLAFTVDGVVADSSNSTTSVDLSPVTAAISALQTDVNSVKVKTDKMIFTDVFVPDGLYDEYYSNVMLLSGCSGINNSTSFTSTSTNTITFTSGPVVSTSQSKFGGSSWFFDGSGGYIAVDNVDLHSMSNFTVEAFIYIPSAPSGFQHLIGSWDGTTTLGWHIGIDTLGKPAFEVTQSGAYDASNSLSAGTAISFNAWHHIAFVKNGTTYTIYVDGNQALQKIGGPSSLYDTGSNITIGARLDNSQKLNAYIDSIRITGSMARYTSNFTVTTSEFPGIAGVIETHIKATPDIAADITPLQSLMALLDAKVAAIKVKTDQLEFLIDGVKSSGGNGGADLASELEDLETIITAIKAKTDILTFTTGVNAIDTTI